ncbi:hypothetical protein GCK72_004402 [Caenorhabditis remanei]|uniref:RING-type domain-containing protein n=1 Tax=Caenorhabditis remanei TaxID=31234 RepID=A0A6A5HCA1_CAERE|nr:hypothetical protein GCK72_004402 [Caenorhabditis remanei]KAF1764454.1 hypothetical protein GCK72_004402 [Caenorhabditis remanei]
MNCNICFHEYHPKNLTPRILTTCGHTLCEECVRKLTIERKIVCPFDRKVTNVKYGTDKLPKNFAVLEIMDTLKNSNSKTSFQLESRKMIDIIKEFRRNSNSSVKNLVPDRDHSSYEWVDDIGNGETSEYESLEHPYASRSFYALNDLN